MRSVARFAVASMATAVIIVSVARAEQVRTPVPDARPVLLAALQAADGTAHGVLTGEIADAITKHFAATSPIYIDVSTEKRYREPGCSRLKVLFWQEGVKLPWRSRPTQADDRVRNQLLHHGAAAPVAAVRLPWRDFLCLQPYFCCWPCCWRRLPMWPQRRELAQPPHATNRLDPIGLTGGEAGTSTRSRPWTKRAL